MPVFSLTSRRRATLAALAERVLEVPDLPGLTRLLTVELRRALAADGAEPAALGPAARALRGALARRGGTPAEAPARHAAEDPRARYLLSEGQLIETSPEARTSCWCRCSRAAASWACWCSAPCASGAGRSSEAEARLVSLVAGRAAIAFENLAYQKELIESERLAALGTMAGMMVHDFRGPMTLIRGWAETLLAGDVPPGEAAERARAIVEAVDRLERMTGETLDFARGAREAGAARGAARDAGGRARGGDRAGAAGAHGRARLRRCPAGAGEPWTSTSCAARSRTSPPTRATRWAAAGGSGSRRGSRRSPAPTARASTWCWCSPTRARACPPGSASACSSPSSRTARSAAPASASRWRGASSRTTAAASSCCPSPSPARAARASGSRCRCVPAERRGAGKLESPHARCPRAWRSPWCRRPRSPSGCRSHDPAAELQVSDAADLLDRRQPAAGPELHRPGRALPAQEPVAAAALRGPGPRALPRSRPEGGRLGLDPGAGEHVAPADPARPGRARDRALGGSLPLAGRAAGHAALARPSRTREVEVFVRIGASSWALVAQGSVERRIGAPDLPPLGAP